MVIRVSFSSTYNAHVISHEYVTRHSCSFPLTYNAHIIFHEFVTRHSNLCPFVQFESFVFFSLDI